MADQRAKAEHLAAPDAGYGAGAAAEQMTLFEPGAENAIPSPADIAAGASAN
jgi:hypothetical protein